MHLMERFKIIIRLGSLGLIALVTACASQIPPEIRNSSGNSPNVSQVRTNPEVHRSQQVRWGGVILKTENKNNASWLTMVAFPLDNQGEPKSTGQSPGRFIAVVDDFLEPLVYSAEREVTIVGELLGTETVAVDEFPYDYPIVKVTQLYLWPVRSARPQYTSYPPYWYDPWYHPFRHRYYRRRHFY